MESGDTGRILQVFQRLLSNQSFVDTVLASASTDSTSAAHKLVSEFITAPLTRDTTPSCVLLAVCCLLEAELYDIHRCCVVCVFGSVLVWEDWAVASLRLLSYATRTLSSGLCAVI